jgi:hypothetical protein
MDYDIGDLLQDWEFDPNEFIARRVKGEDGTDKIQIRIDMGVLQLELQGRPDGQQPHGHSSLLDYYLAQLQERKKEDENLGLEEEECEDLFQEAWQYYHRYLSLFYLEDYEGVVRDTEHTLRIFDLVQDHAYEDEVKWYFDQYYPHAIMMQARSNAMLDLSAEDYAGALKQVQWGIDHIERFIEGWEEEGVEDELPELAFLYDWYEELEAERPLSPREQLERDLSAAVATENFEEAARLRDKIKMLRPGVRPMFRPGGGGASLT